MKQNHREAVTNATEGSRRRTVHLGRRGAGKIPSVEALTNLIGGRPEAAQAVTLPPAPKDAKGKE